MTILKIHVFNPHDSENPQDLELQPSDFMEGEFLIGRLLSCDLVLSSLDVSRQHAKILLESGEYYFIDLGSSGGSWFNEAQAIGQQRYPLSSGDRIRIADYSLEITLFPSQALAVTQIAHRIADRISENRAPDVIEGLAKTTVDPAFHAAAQAPDQIQQWQQGDITVRCIQIIEETPDVKTFRFVASPPILFTYQPGQFVTLHLEIEGESVQCAYSISSPPSRPHTLDLTVKRIPLLNSGIEDPRSLVSNWLHDHLSVGNPLKLSGPYGQLTCAGHPAHRLLLISAGSGIAPMMSMARWIYDTATNRDVVFLHSTHSLETLIFRKELEMMACRLPSFRLALTLTRPDYRQGWLGFTGRISAPLIQEVVHDFRDRTAYVCGSEGFMDSIKRLMNGLDFPMQNYYEERSFEIPRQTTKVELDPLNLSSGDDLSRQGTVRPH
ncbi:MAG: FHA domain-containing protein [Thermosynechococcaceae cyanobacterium MS004]|nr:FHA domain-containing protein [Thermosynechococcaceae cyanobacterium MS004]